MKLLAVGGGSGGHVTPVLAVINQLAARDALLSVRFVCDKAFASQSRGLMQHAAVPVRVSVVTAGKLRRYHHLTFWQHFTVKGLVVNNIIDTAKIAIGFLQSFWLLLVDRPDVVFAKGGYVCLPLGLAAKLLRIPLIIHDSDSRPGLTSRLLAPHATLIATGYPLEYYNYPVAKTRYTGVPIATEFSYVDDAKQRELKAARGIPANARFVVVTGGGLGAKTLNDGAIAYARLVGDAPVMVYNVTGKKHFAEAVEAGTSVLAYTPVEFVYTGMAELLGAADVVVTRASATFLQELAGLGKSTIIVPAKQLSDQVKNAAIYQEADAAIVLDDAEIETNPRIMGEAITRLLVDDAARAVYGQRLHAFARPDAAHQLAGLIHEVALKKHKRK